MKIEDVQIELQGKPLFAIKRLEMQAGERVGLIGRNGCGKSTLLSLLTGNRQLENGRAEILVDYAYVPQLGENEVCLSGGQAQIRRVKQAAAKKAALLVLDEPTAHLDQEGAKAVERILTGYPGSVLVVSHDRALLDGVCTRIWELEGGTVQEYRGNYTNYAQQKEAQQQKRWQEYTADQEEKRRLTQAVWEKQRQSGQIRRVPKRMGNAEARLHKMGGQSAKKRVDQQAKALRTRLTQLQTAEKPWEEKPVRIGMPKALPLTGKVPLAVRELAVFAGEREILSDVSFCLQRGERLGITGGNGSGKTSLLRAIMKRREGVCLAGGVVPGYFRQDLSLLDKDRTVLENLMEETDLSEWEMRSLLAGLHVPGDRMDRPAGVLSGGEQVKASLLKVITGGNNLLILDEPTNFLDIPSLKALERALLHCDKPMLIVSHDRAFMQKVCTRLLCCASGKVREHTAKNAQKIEVTVLKLRQTALLSQLCREKDEGKKAVLEAEYEKVCLELRRYKNLRN